MSITFESVGYSYTNPTRQEKKRRKHERRNHKNAKAAQIDEKERAEDAPSLEVYGKPAWGVEADAVWALQGINFTLEDGEFLGVAGHTGSGKSTLIQHMNGLMHPTCGRVLFDGKNLADKEAAQACRGRVGVVFQYPEHQLFAATVYDDIAFGPRNLGLDNDEVDCRVRTALKQVHLPFEKIWEKSPFELSGGQQRRVAFAGVLAMSPDILVLDEPVAGLDPLTRSEFLELIEELHKNGLTVVMVSHSMDDLARFADRILVLNEGKQFALGDPADIFTRGEALRAIGLDVPAAQKLANELREYGFHLPQALYRPETLADDIAAALLLQSPAPTEESRV